MREQWGRRGDLQPAANADIEARLRRLEEMSIRSEATLEHLAATIEREFEDQRLFRQRVMWAVASAILLAILRSVGLDALSGG